MYFESWIAGRTTEIAEFKLNSRHLRSGRISIPLGGMGLFRAQIHVRVWHSGGSFKAR